MTDTQPSGAESALDLDIDKLEELAKRAEGDWPFHVRVFQSAVNHHVVLKLIALARRATAPHAGPAPAERDLLTLRAANDWIRQQGADSIANGVDYVIARLAAQPVEAGSAVQADYNDPTLACSSCGLTMGESRRLGHLRLGKITTHSAEPVGWDDSWKVVIGAAAALAQIHIEDEDEREAMMVHVRKIASTIPKLGGRPAVGGTLVAKAEPVPFRVGNEYQTQAGEWVRFVGIANEGTDYETMFDEKGHHRYTRRDFGRGTGTAHDYSDPGNTPPLYLAAPTESAAAPADQNAARLAFLHSVNKDSDGYEYGVAKVKFSPSGQIESFLWALSDHSDIDAAMLATQQPTPTGEAEQGEKS